MTEPLSVELDAFDANGFHVGFARLVLSTGRWLVLAQKQTRTAMDRAEAEEVLRGFGAVRFEESDGIKR